MIIYPVAMVTTHSMGVQATTLFPPAKVMMTSGGQPVTIRSPVMMAMTKYLQGVAMTPCQAAVRMTSFMVATATTALMVAAAATRSEAKTATIHFLAAAITTTSPVGAVMTPFMAATAMIFCSAGAATTQFMGAPNKIRSKADRAMIAWLPATYPHMMFSSFATGTEVTRLMTLIIPNLISSPLIWQKCRRFRMYKTG